MPTEVLQCRSEIVVQFDRVRPLPERSLEIADRAFLLAELLTDIAEVVERVDDIRREVEGPFVTPHRLGTSARHTENITEVMIGCRVTAVGPNRFADIVDRAVEATELMLNQTEQMQALRMAGIDRQDLATNPLRIGCAPRTMMGQRTIKPPGHRCHRK